MDLGFLKPSGSWTQKVRAFAERLCSWRTKIHEIDGVPIFFARGDEGAADLEEAIRDEAIPFDVGSEVAKINIFKIGTKTVAHASFHQEPIVAVMGEYGAFDEVTFANRFFASCRVRVEGVGAGDDPVASTPPALVALGKFLIITTPREISEMLTIVSNDVDIYAEGTPVVLLYKNIV